MLHRYLIHSVLLITLSFGSAAAQDSTFAWLRVNSNLPNSLVLVDSLYVGKADGSLSRLSAGDAVVVVVPTEVGAWDLPQPEQSIRAERGDTLLLVMNFPYQYRIDSVPFGASVTIPDEDNRLLGKTPLVYATEDPLRHSLLLLKEGYVNAMIDPGHDVINRHSVALQPLAQTAPEDLAVEWQGQGTSHSWINWAAAGLIVTGGALAVHFKFKANDQYDQYLETGDPAIKENVDRLDLYSYVALGAMQVGVGILAIRLAF